MRKAKRRKVLFDRTAEIGKGEQNVLTIKEATWVLETLNQNSKYNCQSSCVVYFSFYKRLFKIE